MRSRFIGGILLIVGTSIGGGMLALPIANAATGFWHSALYLLMCWIVMTLGAFFILEVNLYLPAGKNMISMADATLGKMGLLTAWLSYLFLLYTLLSAYISGGSDVLDGILKQIHVHIPPWQLILGFTLLFGSIVYGGIRQVDLLNRGLMFAKLGVYLALIILFAPYVQLNHLQVPPLPQLGSSIMILITSFGFAIIVPNLREYFNDDIRALKQIIFIGSLIPLICYLAWDAVIMGTISQQDLLSLTQNEHASSALAMHLSETIHHAFIHRLFNFFTSICMLTAFLGVSLCLMSFLGDGLNLTQKGKQGMGLFLLTFLPPLLLVLYFPGAYLHALNYAGFLCVILLLLLPALMSYAGRKHFSPQFIVPGGLFSQGLVIISSLLLLILAI